jgi:hypothetical protein
MRNGLLEGCIIPHITDLLSQMMIGDRAGEDDKIGKDIVF